MIERTQNHFFGAAHAGQSGGPTHGQPPFELGQSVVTPEGDGVVAALTQRPGDWEMLVQLDAGGRWLGVARAVSLKKRKGRSSRKKS